MLYSSDLLKSRRNKHVIEQKEPEIEKDYFIESLEMSTGDGDTKVILHNEKDSNFYRDYIEFLLKDACTLVSADKSASQISILKRMITSSDKFNVLYKNNERMRDIVCNLPDNFTIDVHVHNHDNLKIDSVNKNIITSIISINNHIGKIKELINMVNKSYSGNKLYSDLLEYENGVLVHETIRNNYDECCTLTRDNIARYVNDFKYFIMNDGILKNVTSEYQFINIKYDSMKSLISQIPSLEDKGYDSVVVNKYSSMLEAHIASIHTLFEDIKGYIIDSNRGRIKYCSTLLDVLYDVYMGMEGNDIVVPDTEDDIETELEAVLFLANLELNQEAAYIDYIRESTGLIALQEAEGVNMMKYIAKISRGITTVFDKFSKGIDKAVESVKKKINDSLDKLEVKIAKLDNPGFTIENYPEFNFDRINMLKVREFAYEEMKPNLATIDRYMKFYYPQVYTYKEGVGVSKAFKEYFMPGTTNLKVTQETLLEMTTFIREDFSKYKENIKTDIATINKANEAIANLSKSTGDTGSAETDQETPKATTSTTTPGATPMTNVNAQNNSVDMGSGTAITEADEEKKKTTKFVDDADRKSPEGANNSTLKNVQVYMSVSTSLISAKLSTVSKRLMLSVRTIIHAFTAPKKNKEQQ